MTRFFAPACGTEFTLDEPWTFLLYVERRNSQLFKAFGHFVTELNWVEVTDYSGYNTCGLPETFLPDIRGLIPWPHGGGVYTGYTKAAQVTFMPGTKLKVARVYIRNGQKGEYDSITLSVHKTTHPLLLAAANGKKKKTYGKFWVKLTDFNQIDGTVLEENVRPHNVI